MRTALSVLAIAALAGCNNTPPVTPGTDAGPIVMTDTGPGDPCAAPTPPATAPYGTAAGRSFRDFTLNNCDGSGAYTFYGDNEWCEPDHRLTVVSIAAVWCVPCQMESAQLTANVTEPYRDRGVRVVQILVQDLSGGDATMTDCTNWVTRFGLTNTELLDPGGEVTNIYFPDNALPSTIIIDEEGIIRFYENGASVGLATLTATIESLLAEP